MSVWTMDHTVSSSFHAVLMKHLILTVILLKLTTYPVTSAQESAVIHCSLWKDWKSKYLFCVSGVLGASSHPCVVFRVLRPLGGSVLPSESAKQRPFCPHVSSPTLQQTWLVLDNICMYETWWLLRKSDSIWWNTDHQKGFPLPTGPTSARNPH